MSSSLHLRKARKEELKTLIQISARAFKGRPLSEALFPAHLQTDPNQDLEFRLERQRSKFDNEDLHYIVVADDQDKPLGWAVWQNPTQHATPPAGSEAANASLRENPPPGMDLAVLDIFEKGTAALGKNLRDALGEDGYNNAWYIDALAVDPDYQRRGIGRMLMQWGQERADQEHRNVQFMASEQGAKLYRVLGYEEVGSIDCLGGMEYAFIKRAS